MAKPVLIVGAGIVGLTIAHGFKKANIPFEIYERDEDTNVRPQGWALTLHWVLPYLERLLDAETFARLETVQVDPEFARHDTGNFLFLNLATEEVKFKFRPTSDTDSTAKGSGEEAAPHGGGVSAIMQDGTSVSGALLIGVEGTNSRIRRFLVPDGYDNYQLPTRMMGVKLEMTEDQVAPLRRLDPLLFQGAHPTTGTFMWFSILDLLKGPDDEIPESNGDRLKQMRTKADGLSPTFDRVIQNIPGTVPVIEVKLVDWVPAPNWDNRGGSVTLAGDAAHAMTMYRGEAANHGILDAYLLVKAITSIYNGEMEQKDAIDAYEAELRRRTQPAVLLSREACLGAHDYDALNENSAVVRRRAVSLTK
ncbi:FAD dependent oxidoreductase [Apiospora saccharicola]|uniref:FAD dependent oxidoreductase n=1 Tax=Apiospora saccharicola TaxID=335842 RepID=A0ABR1UPI4_9PEZI